MNIKALIKKYEELWNEHSPFYEPVPYTSMVELFLKELKQLDEPEKVKVPQFVDDVIKGAREHSPELEDALHYACSNGSREFTEWYQKKSNRDLFARAWLDGYEVEKEKRYYVRFKWIEEGMKNQSKCIKVPREIRPFDIGYRIVNKYGQALALRNGASIFDLPFLAEKAIEKEFGKNDPDFDIGKHSVEEVAIVNLSKFHSYFEEVE
ncbi:Protein of uncharacterised function (DUF1642) [Streptococcus pneumoniae]|nr:Protein of uncharacterised function (DUF1642) [Streptococcus pneumoniae]SNG09362.1 Protein of uncharacterised function (DUF1642) [Streptococcus pneumoniae]VQW25925.1 Protein of uncharacterised function (DUF1642) [Streptococcus pneumoniae]